MIRPRASGLEVVEVHVWSPSQGTACDLSVSRALGRVSALDVGLFVDDGGERIARAARAAAAPQIHLDRPRGRLRASVDAAGRDGKHAAARVDLAIEPAVHWRGITLARTHGRVEAFDRTVEIIDGWALVRERHAARRPYAWSLAAMRGEHEGQPLLCVVATARRRAGSVVLPELGTLRLIGPGAARLPASLRLAPLPIRAEYGSGRLRATALAPRHRVSIELSAALDRTAVFEVVDPGGEAAYAHRALWTTGVLVIERRGAPPTKVQLEGRYEWGARAGDPRAGHRAWSS